MAAQEAVVARLEAAVARLEAFERRQGGGGGGGGAAGGAESIGPAVAGYDAFYAAHVQPFLAHCEALGDLAKNVLGDVKDSFTFQRTFVEATTKCKKPDQASLQTFIKPIVDVVMRATARDDNRAVSFNYDKAWGASAPLFNWIFAPGPVSVIKETVEAGEFYTTKIMVSAKAEANAAKQAAMRGFAGGLKNLINEMAAYVKEYHLTGPAWNPKGGELGAFKAGGGAGGGVPAAPAAPPAPPAPPVPAAPPAPPAGAAPPAPSGGGGGAVGLAAVFGEINRGAAVTAGLKHVTKEMKTKNRPAGDEPPVPVSAPKSAPAAAAPAAAAKPADKPASTALRQGTWYIENWTNTTVDLKADELHMKHGIYIYGCKNVKVNIPVKIKAVQMDNCQNTTVTFDSVVSTFEVVRCNKLYIYPQVACQAYSFDQSKGIQLHLTKASSEPAPSVYTSSVSEVNVSMPMPGASADDDPKEFALAEQFVSTFKGGAWVTEAVKHSD